MLPEGWASLVALLDGLPDPDLLSRAQRLCALCVHATTAGGASLGIASVGQRSTVCATDAVSDRLEELQVTLAEGPCVEALRNGRPVLVADLSGDSERRWPWFAPAAVEAGARGFFVLPLQVGAIRPGVLSMYRTSPGSLDDGELHDVRVLADAATLLLTLDGAEHSAQAFLWAIGDRSRFQAQVHQAVGVLMVRLGLDARDAFARLCAHSYVEAVPVAELAQGIVAGRLRLEPD